MNDGMPYGIPETLSVWMICFFGFRRSKVVWLKPHLLRKVDEVGSRRSQRATNVRNL